MKLYCKEDIS